MSEQITVTLDREEAEALLVSPRVGILGGSDEHVVFRRRAAGKLRAALNAPQPGRCTALESIWKLSGQDYHAGDETKALAWRRGLETALSEVERLICSDQPERYTVEARNSLEQLIGLVEDHREASSGRGNEGDRAIWAAADKARPFLSAAFPDHSQPAPGGEDGDWVPVTLMRGKPHTQHSGVEPRLVPIGVDPGDDYETRRYLPAPDSGEGER